MRRVLVTGGAGFVGVALVRQLVERTDARVSVLDSLTYAACPEALALLPTERVDLVVGDVADPGAVDPLVARCDTVVHVAAASHNDTSLQHPEEFVRTNLVGTFTVLESVRRYGVRLHHVSTDEVYGSLDLDSSARFTELSAYDPSSPYSATKAGADLMVRAWARSFGVRATLSNCSNNYGPWQHLEKFIPRQITTVLDGGRPRLYGDGRHVRDWIHVDDHASAVLAILERGVLGETYLVGADGERSNLEVAREILTLLDRDPADIDLVSDRPGHDRRYALDAARLRTELGWEPRHRDFTDSLARTIEWYASHEDWWRPHKQAVEATYSGLGK